MMFRFVNIPKMLRIFAFVLFIFAVQQFNCDGLFTSSYSVPGTPSYQQNVELHQKLRASGLGFNGPMAGSPPYMGTFYPMMPPL